MAITFTSPLEFRTSNSALTFLSNQSRATLSFRMSIDASVDCTTIVRSRLVGTSLFTIDLSPSTTDPTRAVMIINPVSVKNVGIQRGSFYNFTIVWDAISQTQTLYANKVPSSIGTSASNTKSSNSPVMVGPASSATGLIYSMGPIAIWNGYAATQADDQMLCDMDPANVLSVVPQIGTSATLRGLWTMSGTVGNAVATGDDGLKNQFGTSGDGSDLAISSGYNGTAVYSSSLIYTPPAKIGSARVSTGGKSIFLFPTLADGVTPTTVTAIDTPPTLKLNGSAVQGNLVDSFFKSDRTYIRYNLPDGVTASASDLATLDLADGWAFSSAGEIAPQVGLQLDNRVGRSCFDSDTGSRTLKIGYNFSDLGPEYFANYHIFRNWRYRWGKGILYNYTSTNNSNGIDYTGYAGPTGLFAVQWDSLQFEPALYTSRAVSTTITPMTQYDNPGDPVTGAGRVHVYQVSRVAGAPTVDTDIRLSVSGGATSADLLAMNLSVYGPGDFVPVVADPSNGVPGTVLDTSDPFALTYRFRDRCETGLGCLRFMDSNGASWGGGSSMAEPEHLRSLSDLSWGDSTYNDHLTIGVTALNPFVPAADKYFYASWLTDAQYQYSVQLAADITTAPAAGTHEDITITVDSANPVMRSLILTAGSEKMRVVAVNGSTVTVERGALGTTPATHSAGTIPSSGRYSLATIADAGYAMWVAEVVTDGPHNRITGQIFEFLDPTDLINNLTSTTTADSIGHIHKWSFGTLVTGPDTILVLMSNGGNNPSVATGTIPSAYVVDPTKVTSPLDIPEAAGFPYEATAMVTASMPGAALWVNLPMCATDAMVDEVARRVRDHFPAGREVWLELSNETWNFAVMLRYFTALSRMLGLGGSQLEYLASRTWEIRNRFYAIFDEQGRGSEIKILIGVQGVAPYQTQEVLNFCAGKGIAVDGVAIAPYIDADKSAEFTLAMTQSDIEQSIDLWIHDLYYYQNGWTSTVNQHNAYIDDYNQTTGNSCSLIGYEGNIQRAVNGGRDGPVSTTLATAISATDSNNNPITSGTIQAITLASAAAIGSTDGFYLQIDSEIMKIQPGGVAGNTLTISRGELGTAPAAHNSGVKVSDALQFQKCRDMLYHPNAYVLTQDLNKWGQDIAKFRQWAIYSYAYPYFGTQTWGIYLWIDQDYGRGDGSDGKANNLHCLAMPDQTYSKTSSTNLDLQNVSVRGAAIRDWNGGVVAGYYDVISDCTIYLRA